MGQQLAALIRAKFPGVYDDIPDAQLEQQVLAKHPEYQDLATPPYQGTPIPGRSAPTEAPEPDDRPVLQGLQSMLRPLAHPQSAGDIASLLIPSALPTRAIRGMVRSAASTLGDALPGSPLKFPVRAVSIAAQKAADEGPVFQSGAPGAFAPIDRYAPNTGGVPAAETAVTPPKVPYGAADVPTASPVSAPARAPAARINGQPISLDQLGPSAREALTQQTPIQGSLRMTPKIIDVPATGGRSFQTVAPIGPTPPSDLMSPRIDVGAEAVGKQAGLSKQAVRDATGPLLGEAPGAASPILPRGPSQKIINKLIQMGPKGAAQPEAARDSYVMAATSDKARAQIKAYLDALRAVGFSGAAGVAARKALTSSMATDQKQGPQ